MNVRIAQGLWDLFYEAPFRICRRRPGERGGPQRAGRRTVISRELSAGRRRLGRRREQLATVVEASMLEASMARRRSPGGISLFEGTTSKEWAVQVEVFATAPPGHFGEVTIVVEANDAELRIPPVTLMVSTQGRSYMEDVPASPGTVVKVSATFVVNRVTKTDDASAVSLPFPETTTTGEPPSKTVWPIVVTPLDMPYPPTF
jgi:hypothetical protein